MHSAIATRESVRDHTRLILRTIGVSRIIVVDDQYAEPELEGLLGACSELAPERAATLPYLDDIDFTVGRDVWTDLVRDRWAVLDIGRRRSLVASAQTLAPDPLGPPPAVRTDPAHTQEQVDVRAAQSLEDILNKLEDCEYHTLSLTEWTARAATFLNDDRAAYTVLLFDRDFNHEEPGADNQGIELVRQVQGTNVRYCGLMTHTVPLGGEDNAWRQLTSEFALDRDKFVVIAKERLADGAPDYYPFLRMLRFVALSAEYASVRSAAWSVFEQSVAQARAAVDALSVLDFDRIVFGSSRREGVWEPDTLFRVFGILMRREAHSRLHQDQDIVAAVASARRISTIPQDLAAALGEEVASEEAFRIQRYECYESAEELNAFHVPIEVGDIFEKGSTHRQYILLAQPCDLMVRPGGRRNYEDHSFGRSAALAQLVIGRGRGELKDSCVELPFFVRDGGPAFADLAKTHHVLLAVLDLCAFRTDGLATIDVNGACPELLIEPWSARYERLQRFFGTALTQYERLNEHPNCRDLKHLALPTPCRTVRFPGTTEGSTVAYDLKRVGRLRQPRSGALLTALAHYQARAAFDHPLERVAAIQNAPDRDEDLR